MANESSSNPFNPMLLWADIGLRSLEMSVSSSQNMGESLDRIARAGASEAAGAATSGSVAGKGAAPTAGAGLVLANQMQRTTFDLMTQNWLQWMSMLGAVASMAAGQNAAAGTMGWGLQPAGTTGTASTAAQAAAASSREQSGSSRESNTGAASKEHAHASAGSQRRRSTARATRKPRARKA